MTPLIYTAKGNVPCTDLRLNPIWEDTPDYTKLSVEHWLGDEMVRNDVYVYNKKGVSVEGLLAQL